MLRRSSPLEIFLMSTLGELSLLTIEGGISSGTTTTVSALVAAAVSSTTTCSDAPFSSA